MARRIRPLNATRSEHWLRVLINRHPDLLAAQTSAIFNWPQSETIRWISPLAADDYAEYSDSSVLDILQLKPDNVPLTAFWPQRGPCWDGLGRTTSGRPLLVEAKAYVEEANSSRSGAGSTSLAHICRSLNQLKSYLRSASPHDWSALFYQYTNRLAHLYFLRQLNGIDAYLIFVYFVNAPDVPEPTSEAQWRGANRLLKATLQLGRRHTLADYIAEVFVDVRELTLA
jgi:hypothetical protein